MNQSSHNKKSQSQPQSSSSEVKQNSGDQSTRLSGLDDRKLKQLASQAKKATVEKEPEKERLERQKKRRRYWKKRIFIWCLELFVLLLVLEYFVLQPHRARQETLRREAEEARITAPGRGDELAEMGTRAVPLAALQEVVPAYQASLEMLAEGSREAQEYQMAYAEDTGLPVEVENSIGMRFRLVPPGSYLKGSPPDEPGRWEGEIQHAAEVREPLYVGKYPVTQEEWRRVMDSSPAYFEGDQRPVESITWNQARRFSQKLNEKETVPEDTYRLPTETEWEYACRAGTEIAFVFGSDPANLRHFAVYNENSYGRTNAVGRFRPNAYGLHNMHGNVWEWCRDTFEHYPDFEPPEPSEDQLYDPTDGQWYNVRGGHWRENAFDCRSATRSRLPADSHGNILGFRIVRTIPELK